MNGDLGCQLVFLEMGGYGVHVTVSASARTHVFPTMRQPYICMRVPGAEEMASWLRAYCFCRGPKFSFQQTYQVTHKFV